MTSRPVTRCLMCEWVILEFIGKVSDYDFFECQSCGFRFTPDVDRNVMEKLYGDGRGNEKDGAPANGWADNTSFLTPALDALPRRSLDILDFGTGHSVLPDILRSMHHSVVGIDLCPPPSGKEHHDRLIGDILEMDLGSHQFDLVASYQVFEHLPRPLPILQRLCGLCKEGGILSIHTDMETKEGNRFLSWDYVRPPDHCSFYRHKSFEILSERYGYDIIHKDAKSVHLKMRKKQC
ncbi:MAG: class I SAM-dependent methyltransferase [Thermoplasmata archaeon]|nr:class I SAM-dependent methyltransferase [Thermoplasmata archaeon]